MAKNKKSKNQKSPAEIIDYKKYLVEAMILLTAIFFLFFNIGHFPTFGDEAFYIFCGWVWNMNGNYLGYADAVPPLLSYLISFSLRIFDDPLFAGRIVSAVFGVIGGIGIYFLANKLYGKKIACIVLALYIFSPFTFFYHRMALRESLMLTGGVFTLFFAVYLVLSSNDRLNWIYAAGLAVSQALSLLTKQHAAVFLIYPIIALAIADKNQRMAKIKFISAAYTGTILIFLIVMFSHPEGTRMITRGLELASGGSPAPLSNLKIISSSVYTYLGPVFLLVSVYSLAIFIRNKKYFEALLFLYPLIIFVGILSSSWVEARYVLAMVLPWFLYIGSSVDLISTRIKKELWAKIVFALIIIGLFIPSVNFIYYYFTNPAQINFTRDDRDDFVTSANGGFGLFDAFEYLEDLSKNKPILVIVEPGFGPKNWPYMLYEKNPNIKVASWSGFRATSVSPYINVPVYTVLDDDPLTGSHYYFKQANPNAELIKRYWRPGRKTYIDIVLIRPKSDLK